MSEGTLTDEQRAKAERKAQKKLLKKQARAEAKASENAPADDTAEVTNTAGGDESVKSSKKRKRSSATEAADGEDLEAKEKAEKKAAKKASKKAARADATSATAPAKQIAAAQADPSKSQAYLSEHSITVEDAETGEPLTSSVIDAFESLRSVVDAKILNIVLKQGFASPTPIQASCWPLLLEKKDVVGVAETGSGKTFAFGVPAVDMIVSSVQKSKKARSIQALAIAPTRELAIQIQEQLSILSEGCELRCFCAYGGVSKEEQQRQIRTLQPSVLVGTPGRMLDLARDGSIDLSQVSYLVLDEADRMLDKGFEPDIRAIISMTKSHSEGRQTCMFSATWPPAVRALASTFMRNPVKVTVGSDELAANRRVSQTVHVLEGWEKERKLQSVLKEFYAGKGRTNKDRILVFALYKKEAQRVESNLRRAGHKVAGIHGDLSQTDRISSLNTFKTAETPLLVATDVAARGLDIPNVELVINYTFPLTAEDYVHRIGRTGRGGKQGASITFFTDEDKAHAGELMRILKDADQPVPDAMNKFPSTIKKKTHGSYGAHFKELVPGKAKKITFD